MKNIVLTGFMGAGKTAAGRELANILKWKLIDIDDEIVKARDLSISDIFSSFGEAVFRDLETEMIRETAAKNNVIISTGGGAVLRQENRELLNNKGIIVCLIATPETILERTDRSAKRPLLDVEDPLGRIKELLESRRPFYEKADIIIDTEAKTPRQVAEEILEGVKCRT